MSKEIVRTVLHGEIIYSVEDCLRMTVTPEDLARIDKFIVNLNKLGVKFGVPPGSTIIDSSVVEPITDSTRLIGTDEA